jgi:tetratricopeptide (TPR) repeat protein
MRAFLLFIFTAFASSAVFANPEITKGYNEAVGLMQKSEWDKAAVKLKAIVDAHGANAAKEIGPAFGMIYYHLGLCQYSLKDYGAAAASFHTCYKKFPNKDGNAARNTYHALSLYQWGRCEQAAGHPDGAIKLYKKFLKLATEAEGQTKEEAEKRIGELQ